MSAIFPQTLYDIVKSAVLDQSVFNDWIHLFKYQYRKYSVKQFHHKYKILNLPVKYFDKTTQLILAILRFKYSELV